MKKSNISIIGGVGRMGSWFGRFFQTAGHEVNSIEGKDVEQIRQAAGRSDVVIVSVPIGETCEVIEKVGPYVKAESLLMDLTSLKAKPVEYMLKYSESEVIGTHPLFGPDAESLKDQTVILCPARANRWFAWLTDIFSSQGARLEIISPERHDRIMTIVQAMAHMNTMLMGFLIKELNENLSDLKRYSTPLFRVQMALVGRLFAQDPRVYAEIIAHNPEVKHAVAVYSALLGDIKKSVDEGEAGHIAHALSDASTFFEPIEAESLATSRVLLRALTSSQDIARSE